MAKPVARVGDSTSHGGTIITGDGVISVNGKPLARVGDLVDCPKCGKAAIVTGVPSIFGSEQLMAIVGSKTSCGAHITSGSPDTFADERLMTSRGAGEGGASEGDSERDERLAKTAGSGGAGAAASSLARDGKENEGDGKDKEEEKGPYNEQFKVVWQDTRQPVTNMKYTIKLTNGGEILAEGRTDAEGLTERVHTELAEEIELYAYDTAHEVDELKIELGTTNEPEDSLVEAERWRGRLFFDIHYIVADNAFGRAAATYRSQALRERRYRPEDDDVWLSFPVKTESQVTAAWSQIHQYQQTHRMEIVEGRILTHGTMGPSGGLEFVPETGEESEVGVGIASHGSDGTFQRHEIMALQPLVWADSSVLYFHSCNSGSVMFSPPLATAFAYGQKPGTIYGQIGWAYFSREEDRYVSTRGYTGREIYLWAYHRGKNVFQQGPFATGKWVRPKTIHPRTDARYNPGRGPTF